MWQMFQELIKAEILLQYIFCILFRLYSCLANGSADEFQKGEHLYKTKSVKEVLQIGKMNTSALHFVWNEISMWCTKVYRYATGVFKSLLIGFHLSASVIPPQSIQQAKGNFNVAVVFDRRRISSCTCTCNSQPSWCSHVVALCLYRIHQVRPAAIVNRLKCVMSFIDNWCMMCIYTGYYNAQIVLE